ncbi:MAG: polysaccharide deacetylase family protein [Actinomycetia bacterium]|nr:polysaccharide deacetylase family protein [Actinomycetes bacterium]
MSKLIDKVWQKLKALSGKALRHRASLKFPRYFLALAILIAFSFFIREFWISIRIQELEREVWYYLTSFAIFLILLSGFISYYEYRGIGPQEGIVRRGPQNKIVALTFDDGPHPVYTEKILKTLKEKNIKATFFVIGKHVKKYKDVALKIAKEGHEIGNHTYSHRDLVPTTRGVVQREVKKTEKIVKEICGCQMQIFRPPRGVLSNSVRKILIKRGYKIILWSVSTQDWRKISPVQILKRVKRFTKDGSIILFHDSGAIIKPEGASRNNTVKALPQVIDFLQEQGYKLVTISELISSLEEEFSAKEAFEEA